MASSIDRRILWRSVTHRKFAKVETLTQGDAHCAHVYISRRGEAFRNGRAIAAAELPHPTGGQILTLRKKKRLLRQNAKK
jgi:hypothetical protein